MGLCPLVFRHLLMTSDTSAWFDRAPCGLLALDPSGRVMRTNQTLREWLGAEPPPAEGADLLDWLRLGGGRSADLLRVHLDMLLRSGIAPSVELRLRRPSGERLIAQMDSIAVRDERGAIERIEAVLTDVGERRVVENRLTSQLAFLQNITDRTPARLVYYDKDLICRFANRAQATYHGLASGDLVGMHLSESVSSEVLSEVMGRVTRALAGEAQTFETERRQPDGTSRFYEVHYVPDESEGEVRGIFIEFNDITDRRVTEDIVLSANLALEARVQERTAELQASERRFRLMADTLKDACIFFVNEQGAVTEWSESAERLHGFRREQVLGKPLQTLLPEPDPMAALDGEESATHALQQALEQGQWETRGWRVRQDGSRFWGHTVITALRDDAGELQAFSCIERDMTVAKNLEDVMSDLNKELEKRVEERTRQLVAANADLDVFSHTVSHDLRAPLRHIASFIALVQEHLGDNGDPVLVQYQDAIGKASRRMAQMIEGLLEYARLGRAPLDVQTVPLATLVQGVAAHLKTEHPERAIEWHIESDLPVVRGDPMLLAEVFANLLDNAVKYTRREPQAEIRVGWTVSPAGVRTFHVRDNGVGFDLDKATNLFVMFQRQHHSMDFEGIGTGLSITRRIIERHGGRIWCETAPGQGCTFYFTLPFEGAGVTAEAELAIDL